MEKIFFLVLAALRVSSDFSFLSRSVSNSVGYCSSVCSALVYACRAKHLDEHSSDIASMKLCTLEGSVKASTRWTNIFRTADRARVFSTRCEKAFISQIVEDFSELSRDNISQIGFSNG